MIQLIGGNVQNASNLAVPNGSIELYLNVDATVLDPPGGQVLASIPVIFQFDANGNLVQPAYLWSNAELSPQNSMGLGTWYSVTFYDSNNARINKVPLVWQFTEITGSVVDISWMGGNMPNIIAPDNYTFTGLNTFTALATFQSIVVGTPIGGNEGSGTINVSGGLYVNGVSVGFVTSVFGRTGAIVAETGDYAVSQVTGAAPLASPIFTGVVSASDINTIRYVGVGAFATIAAAFADLPGTGGTVYVASGTAVTGPIVMPSNTHLVFGTGTFVNHDTAGGDTFIIFNVGVSNSHVSGQGMGVTILQNAAAPVPQFGTVITDQGTENTVSDLTADGNNNTTDVLLWRQSTRSHCRNVRSLQAIPIGLVNIVGNGTLATVTALANTLPPGGLVAGATFSIAGNSQSAFNVQSTVHSVISNTSFTFLSSTSATGTGGYVSNANLGSAFDVECGSDHEFTNVEGYGGGGGGDTFNVTTDDGDGFTGSVVGGRYSNVFLTLGSGNGFSLNAKGPVSSGFTITGLVVNNIRVESCGYVGTIGGADDMSGIAVVSNLTSGDGTSVSDCVFTGINCNNNGGQGLRLKGTVARCSFSGSSEGNGLRELTTYDPIDAVVTLVGATAWPFQNRFDVVGNKGNGSHFVNEGSGSYGNVFSVASPDASIMAGESALFTDAAIVFRGSDFANPTDSRTAFYNQAGVGATINGYGLQVTTGTTPEVALTIDENQNSAFTGPLLLVGALTVQGATPSGALTGIGFGTTTAATATGGAATLPSNPVGFLEINIGGTVRKFPYYAV